MAPETLPTPSASTRFDRVTAVCSERTTPLFVKELRQALRGKYLKITLSISIALSTIAAFVVLGIVVPLKAEEIRAYSGLILFGATFGATAFVATFFVPFAAFNSMNAEADENTLELLQLSNLSPLAIASGKLASATLQAVLVSVTAMPFAVVAWHMGGIPPSLLVLAPLFTVIGAACFSSIAIALSTLSRVRWVRIVLMVLFGFFLFNFGQYVLFVAAFGTVALVSPGMAGLGSAPGGAATFGVSLVAALGGLGFLAVALTFAANMLAHREESGSTGMRRVTSVLAVVGALAIVLGTIVGGGGAEAAGVAGLALSMAFPALAWCCTEREKLPLGPLARPPQTGIRGWFAIPHLAGGGRGALLATCVCAGTAFAGASAAVLAEGRWTEEATVVLGLGAFVWIYLLLPSVVFSPWSDRVVVRVLARVGLFAFPWVAFLGTSLLMAVVYGPSGAAFENAANPFYLFGMVDSRGVPSAMGPWMVLAFFVVLTFVLNAWRMARGVLDVRRAMRERDARERGGAAL